MADKLSVGDKLSAKYIDGRYYSAEVLSVSKSSKRAKAPVKVRYIGYGEEDAWLPLSSLRSKLLKEEEAQVDYSKLTAKTRVQVQSDGSWYAAEVLTISNSEKRKKAPVKVRYAGYTAASDEWVGADRLRSKLLKCVEEATLLTPDTVPAFVVRHLKRSKGIPINTKSKLTAAEICGGNLNYAFVAKDDGDNAVFVKQAPDFIKVLGRGAKLSRERMRLELRYYRDATKAIGKEVAKEYIPTVYTFDAKSMAFIMDFLGDLELLQKTLFDGVCDEGAAKGLGRYMGLVHASTHASKLDEKARAQFTKVFDNATLRGIQLEYVFSKCYREDDRAAKLRDDAGFMAEIEKIKSLYKGETKENLALCHGDLHGGSVMAKGSSAKIIDPEFTVYGPPGLDVGSLTSTYALAYCFQAAKGNKPDVIIAGIEAIWSTYTETMKTAGISDDLIATIGMDAAGFAGCEITRTALGLAYERSMRIENEVFKAKTELAVMDLGAVCVRNRNEGIKALIVALKGFRVE